jgi:hypothetical protein
MQLDVVCNANGSKRTTCQLDDVDASKSCITSKRQRLDQVSASKNYKDKPIDDISAMDVSMEDYEKRDGCNTISNLSADEILVQMVQSACYSQEDVVNFCITTGIPISRMLRLDLIRVCNHAN